MPAYLYAVVAARAVDQELAIDVDSNVVDLHPPFAATCAAAPDIRAIALASRSVLAGKEDKIPRLKLRGIRKQHAHITAFLRHAR